MSGSGVMSLARTSPGTDVFSISVLGCSTCIFSGTRFRLRMRSVVSSIAPGMGENSCSTPSTRTAVMAAPSMLDSSTRRSALPTVVANPRSKGWAVNRPKVSVSASRSTSRRLGFWNPFHNMCFRSSVTSLLGVQLDDELLLDGEIDVVPARHGEDLALHARGVDFQPLGHAAALDRVHRLLDQRVLGGTRGQLDDVVLLHLVGGNVELVAVHLHVAVAHQLARLGARAAEAKAVGNVVEPALELGQQLLAHHALLLRGAVEGERELVLQHAVQPLDLLLLAQLQAVALQLGLHAAALAVLAGRVVALLDRALLGEAALALEEELHALPPAQPANRTDIPGHA